jgi:CheY-like chemotaxis protein
MEPLDKLSVLLVDDEPVALEVTQGWLEELGCTVRTASTAHDALALLDTHSFDLMVADVLLEEGGRDGFEVAMAAADRQHQLPVIFVSAYAWGPSQAEQPDTTFLHKPFTRQQLAHSIRFCLARLKDR